MFLLFSLSDSVLFFFPDSRIRASLRNFLIYLFIVVLSEKEHRLQKY